jgi:hypothetical protein
MDDHETRDLLADFLRWLVDEGYAASRMLPYDATSSDIALRYIDAKADEEAGGYIDTATWKAVPVEVVK